MAKLPDIQYLTPTESLGRADVGQPGRLARQNMKLIEGIGDIVLDVGESLMAQRLSTAQAGAQSELARLKDNLMFNRTVDVEALDDAGIQYEGTNADGSPRQTVSSHAYMGQLWEAGVREIMQRYGEGLSPGQRREMGGSLAGSVSAMTSTLTAQAHKWRLEEINASTEQDVYELRNSATYETKDEVKMQIQQLINRQIRSGFIDADAGMKKIREARADVDYFVIQQQIRDGSQKEIDEIEMVLALPPEDNGLELTSEARKKLYTQIDSRQARLETNRAKVAKEESERVGLATAIRIHEEGSLEWNEMRDIVRDMDPADGRLLVTLNSARMKEEREEIKEGDDTIYNQLEKDILGAPLTSMAHDISPQAMKDAIVGKIQQKLTDHMEGRPGIDANQAHILYGRIGEAMKQMMKPIGYEDALELLSGYITKGSVANQGTRDNGAMILMYNIAKGELIDAIRAGTTRDPLEWVRNNYYNYLTETTLRNITKSERLRAERYEVPATGPRPENAPPFDRAATIEAARKDLAKGKISPRLYEIVVDTYNAKMATHLKMLHERERQAQED